MSPLEVARRLAESDVFESDNQECIFCGMAPGLHGVPDWEYVPDRRGSLHYPECHWLMLPVIIAALEAAAGIVAEVKRQHAALPYPDQWPLADCLSDYDDDGDRRTCYGCGAVHDSSDSWGEPIQHELNCAWLALLAALHGQEAGGDAAGVSRTRGRPETQRGER